MNMTIFHGTSSEYLTGTPRHFRSKITDIVIFSEQRFLNPEVLCWDKTIHHPLSDKLFLPAHQENKYNECMNIFSNGEILF